MLKKKVAAAIDDWPETCLEAEDKFNEREERFFRECARNAVLSETDIDRKLRKIGLDPDETKLPSKREFNAALEGKFTNYTHEVFIARAKLHDKAVGFYRGLAEELATEALRNKSVLEKALKKKGEKK